MMVTKNVYYPLSDMACLAVEGEEAQAFLQGQLTADMRQVDASHMTWSALCRVDGRVIALMYVVYWEGWKLCLASDMLDIVKQTLDLPARLSKVTLRRLDDLYIWGLHGRFPRCESSGAVQLGDHYTACLGDGDYLLLSNNALEYENTALASHFYTHRLEMGHVRIYPATTGLFLPHYIGLPDKGYIAFDKGCYRGQEIIARMQYRGNLKYHLEIGRCITEAIGIIGQKSADPRDGGYGVEWVDTGEEEDGQVIYAVISSVS
jgi:folate-binding protein YgfZ